MALTTTRSRRASDRQPPGAARRKRPPRYAPLWQTPLPPDVPGAWFDQAAVDKVLRALRALRQTKGKRWSQRPLELEPWQIEYIVAPVFGWKHPDGSRIIRTVWIEIPRKNGKSTLASGLAIVGLCADGEPGAEVYSAAASRDQAKIVFNEAKAMAQSAGQLAGRLRYFVSAISVPNTQSTYRVLSRIAEVAHGLNVHFALIDEVHIHAKRDLIDALETGTGARDQPLIVFITTADDGAETSIYAEKHAYTINLAKRLFADATFYGVIWAAAETDDPFKEATWRKANPGYGTILRPDYVRKEAQRAKQTPTYLPTFKRLQLNLRVRSESRFLELARWDASAGLVTERRLEGRICYGGLDLASSTDIAALELVFPMDPPRGKQQAEEFAVLSYFWVPEESIAKRGALAPAYRAWVRQGRLLTTQGDIIDTEAIRLKIGELGARFRVREIAYDRWGAFALVPALQGMGFTCVPMGQGYASMSAPTKKLEELVLAAKLRHGGHPVLRWMADNLAVRRDAAANLKPVKPSDPSSPKKIDGMVALIMGLDRAIRNNDRSRSVYEDRGLVNV